jgi:rhodanese-related sulfurtransferase
MAPPITVHWTTNRVLAALGLALGLVAIAGNPVRGHTVRIDTQELATMVSSEVDHVSPVELAEWIIRGATDYRLVDLRAPAAFAAYHIPTAENVPLAELPDHGLGRNEKIVLYSDGGIHSAQAWFLLRAQDYRGVYILLGGLDAWKSEVVFPTPPARRTPQEAAAFERAAQVARYFGGGPRAAAASGGDTLAAPMPSSTPAAPQVVMPAAPAGPGRKGPAAAKKREGC